MKVARLSDMKDGWFIGNFVPSLYQTTDCEIAVKTYKKGQSEQAHYHKIATEHTVIINGKAKINGAIYQAGDIVVVDPGEPTTFECLEDTITVVVKIPGALNDKYVLSHIEL
ncbi:hypothetical protein [Bartonella sp. TP]|uniref:cupin domain-containing protein n=1 Tax=Bartonella sp. TP TaxID=3057550 RepID=UPI0025B15A9D|nr:hypothetical protein [Bartonella sp. TP]MDN5249318.1 hypothetical protein [Alphaproteobacteria bacterium]WJW79694.1 hypothetical protein QVL57_04045 [Bartonella sp. TP]